MSFNILTLPVVSLSTSTLFDKGALALDLLSDENPGEIESPVTLTLRLNSHTFKLVPQSPVTLLILSSGERIYTFTVAASEKSSEKVDDSVKVTVPVPTQDAQHVAADIETFDQVLTQYTNLSWSHASPQIDHSPPPPLPARRDQLANDAPNIKPNVEEHKPVQDPSLRGRLLLMDEANGDVVGKLPESVRITEDPFLPGQPGVATGGGEPVVLEMHPDMYDACTGVRPLGAEGEDLLGVRDVFARVIPAEEQDWMMKGASFVSQAISSSTSLLLSGITFASDYYIDHSAPGIPATATASGSGLNSSPSTTNYALTKAHALTGQARAASAKTADVVGGVIRRAMGGSTEVSSSTPSPTLPPVYTVQTPGSTDRQQGPPPPYAVYTPKTRQPPPPTTLSEKAAGSSEETGPKKPLGRIDRVLMSADLVLTTVDDSARRMFEVSTDRLGAVVGHKYGRDAQRSTYLASHSARNIVLVYVDMRGFARRALLQRAGKEFVKARVVAYKKNTDTNDSSPAPPNLQKA